MNKLTTYENRHFTLSMIWDEIDNEFKERWEKNYSSNAKWATHRLSKFDRSVVLNLKPICYFFHYLYQLEFDLETSGVS